MSSTYYDVKPRYSSGSPASVNKEMAEAVKFMEVEFYHYAKGGAWGEKYKKLADEKGLRDIVIQIIDHGYQRIITDLITGTKFIEPKPR